ncbi:CdaR family protein [Caldifermentibacillus hisashii]|uniref:CdaR family protein n=1 Tax=Caldifermentibacillus hisashii TaxID=996558 RepID=UPI0034D68075
MDKFLNKLMESKWFVRGLALVLALLLYITAYIDQMGPASGAARDNTTTETIEDVPVVLYYDEENFVVTGAPQTVDVIVEGNSSLVKSAKNLRDFTVYLDLTKAEIGTQRVKFQVRDISDKLTVSIKPEAVNVNVQEKVTKEFTVDIQFNKALLEDGYQAEEPVIKPKKVKITGGKDVIDQINYVKAIVERNEVIDRTFTQKASVSVLDQNLNKLNVQVEPAEVEVTIPVKSPQKTVPVVIKQQGTPKEGVSIKNIEPAVREVVLYGRQSALDKISSIEIPVNVANISGDQELTIPITLGNGITAVTPEAINVKVTTETKETRTIKNVPVNYTGLSNQYALDFLDPDNGQVDIDVIGTPEVLQNINVASFHLTVNAEGLTEGEHELKIQAEGPDSIDWKLKRTTVKVKITAEG